MSHITLKNEPCRTREWAMSHMWMSHVTHVNESRHICERVTSHMWTSHVTHVNESCHTGGYGQTHILSHSYMSTYTYMYIHICIYEYIQVATVKRISSVICGMTHSTRKPSRSKKQDLEMFQFSWCLIIENFVVQIISLLYLQNFFWYKCIVCSIPLYRVLYRLRIHSSHA